MIARVLVYLLLDTGIAWMFGDLYRVGLARAVEAGFWLLGNRVDLFSLEVLSPLDLAWFIALCLGTTPVRPALRVRALLIGTPMLLAIEVVLGMFLMYSAARGSQGHPFPALAIAVRDSVMASYAWVMPILLWLVLLGGQVSQVRRLLSIPPSSSTEAKGRRSPTRPKGRSA